MLETGDLILWVQVIYVATIMRTVRLAAQTERNYSIWFVALYGHVPQHLSVLANVQVIAQQRCEHLIEIVRVNGP
jgi:hypothetical protein